MYSHTHIRISLFVQADFDRLGLASYSKLRLVRQDHLMLCPTYPLLLLVPSSFPEKDLHAVSVKRTSRRSLVFACLLFFLSFALIVTFPLRPL